MPGKKNRSRSLTLAEVIALTDKVSQGDPAARRSLREFMHQNRDRLQSLVADRCRLVRGLHTEGDSSAGVVRTLAINAHLDRISRDLAGEGNSRVEQLMIDRVTLCWLTLNTLEEQAARDYLRSPGKVPAFDKELEHAHRRFVRAVIDLARLRRIGRGDGIEAAANARVDGEPARRECAE